MAIYHLKAKVYSRSKGHSAVAAAAYRARADLVDQRTGLRHDYRHHSSECLFEGIYAPQDAPEWTRDRAQLWNHVEAFETKRNAQLSREFEIALPHELTLEQNRYLLQDFIRENFTRKGLIADAAIHAPGKEGDLRNIHAHVMVVMRKLDGTEFERLKEQKTLAEHKKQLEEWRASWEHLGNKALKRWGFEPTLDRRSLEAQGINRAPGVHLGKAASEMEARGIQTDRGDRQRAAANENSARAALLHLVSERDREAEEWHEADKKNRKAEAESKTLDELAAEQAAEFIRRDRERAEEGGFKTTLDGIRAREADEKNSSMDRQGRRALDELAAVDPIGTARHFGHHRGDRLKTPEEMRAEYAPQRTAADAAPAPEPTRTDPQAEQEGPGRERVRNWKAEQGGFDALNARQRAQAVRSFEAWQERRRDSDQRARFDVLQYVAHVQEQEAKRQAADARENPAPSAAHTQPAPSRPAPAPEPARADPQSEHHHEAPGRERARTWKAEQEGFDALNELQQAAAKRSFEAWRERRRDNDQRAGFDLPRYVAYVQEQEAKRQAAEAHKARPTPTPEKTVERKPEPQPSPASSKTAAQTPEPKPAPAKMADPLEARRAWAANLRAQTTYTAPQEAARRPETPARPNVPPRQAEAPRSPENRPAAAFTRAATNDNAGRERPMPSRAPATASTSRPAPMPPPAAASVRQGTVSGGHAAPTDRSSEKANRAIAAEAADAARRQAAEEAAANREKAWQHDQQQRENDRNEAERGRELQQQERRSIWEDESREAEIRAAAERLRRELERPDSDHTHGREL